MKKEYFYIRVKKYEEKIVDAILKVHGYIDTDLKVGYHKGDYGWNATDLDTGLSITSEQPTRKKCIEMVELRKNALFEVRGSSYYKDNCKKLIEYLKSKN